MQQELAVLFSDLDMLTFTVIGKGIFDDGCVVLVNDVRLRVTGGEDDVPTNCDPHTYKCRREDIFVVDDC